MQPLSGLSWGVSAWGTPELKGKVVWTERGKGYRTHYGRQRRGILELHELLWGL